MTPLIQVGLAQHPKNGPRTRSPTVAFPSLPYKDNQGSNPPPLKLFHISRGQYDEVSTIGLFGQTSWLVGLGHPRKVFMVKVENHLAMKFKKIRKNRGEFLWANELALHETTIEYVDSTKSQKKYIVYIKPFFNSKFKIMITQNDNSCLPIGKQSSPNNLLPL